MYSIRIRGNYFFSIVEGGVMLLYISIAPVPNIADGVTIRLTV
jgi:hypothetical protein